ncbi:MAG: hypothetical protein JWO28_2995 [Hyphomicrobiales bacterium]|nr:hypothetical protein [Hyphomicrobiales bacterium]
MWKILVAMAAAFCLFGALPAFAGSYQSDGTYQGSPSSAVTALFASHPNGDDALVAALRELLLRDPTLADDIAYSGSRANAAQQQAAAAALAQALIVLTARGNTFGAGRIVSAAQFSGNTTIQTAVAAAVATAVGSNTQQQNPSTQANCTRTGGNTVSPASPTTTCQ